MPSTRTINRLTEAWPDEPGNFELQAFAASLADNRAELSPPALDRIGDLLTCELDKQSAQKPAVGSRLFLFGQTIGAGARWFAPYAVAACLVIAAGVWFVERTSNTPDPAAQPGGSLVTDQPPHLQPATPEDPATLKSPSQPAGS